MGVGVGRRRYLAADIPVVLDIVFLVPAEECRLYGRE